MRGRIPDNILDDILGRVDIVELIGGYIPLKKAGRNFKANCPFHHEKTPSFMVSPDRQIYHCFGCGAGGNAFNFLMQHERLEFPEAVELLARKSGVKLPESQKQDPQVASLSAQLCKVNELAAYFYEQALDSALGSAANNYLLKRGVKKETLKIFKVGYAPDSWDALISHLRAKGIGLALMEKAGLIVPKDGGGYYDRFRSRIIFPIFDIKSRPIAFGGRILADSAKAQDLAKYVNSPETPVYIKGRNLYGLNFAKDSIRDADYAVVVEGYLDLIMPYQEGLNNIVASLGTALTIEQAQLLKRHTHNAVMVYDPDTAGEMATLRSLDIFIEEGMNVRVVSLPEGFDPDLFVRKHGIAAFKEKIAQAENLFDYKLRILKSRYNFKEVQGKAEIASGMLPTINKFKNAVLRAGYLKKLSEELHIPEDALLQELKKVKEDKVYPQASPVSSRSTMNISATEKMLIKLMLEEAELINRIKDILEPGDFQDERTARIISVMFDLIAQGKEVETSKLISHLADEELSQLLCESQFMEVPPENRDKIIDDCVRRLKADRIKLKKCELHEEIKTAQRLGDEPRLRSLMEEFDNLIRKR